MSKEKRINARIYEYQSKKLDMILKERDMTISQWVRERIDNTRLKRVK